MTDGRRAPDALRGGLLLLLLGLAAADVRAAPATRCEAPHGAAGAELRLESEAALDLERGNALLERGDPATALDAYEESRRRALATGDERLAVRAAANVARAAVLAERLEGVDRRLEETLAAAGDLADVEERVRIRIHVGRTYALLAQRGSTEALRRAADAFGRASREAADAGDALHRSYALGYLGELYERRGRHAEAVELSRRAIVAAEQAEAPEALYRWQWQLGRIRHAAGVPDAALAAYREAARVLGDLREQTALRLAAGEPGLSRDVETIYLELVDLLLRRAAAVPESDERQALLAEARDVLESQKAAELRDYFADACLDAQRKATPDEIPGALVVYPIALPDRVELIVSSGGRLERHRLPIDGETLDARVRAFRRLLEKRTTRQFMEHAHTLYDWLVRPLEPQLSSPETEVLVFVPAGALLSIPLGALRDRETKTFLIEKVPIAIVPSLTLTNPRPIDRGQVRLLAAGITEAVQGFPALDFVADEIKAVNAVFPGRTLMNDEFVRDRFESEITGRPFGIVHIASHGEFSGDPSETFLLTYDGRFTIEELAALVATTRFRGDASLELLTLSACETAAGDDRAALGLAGVALRAGARSALATLWSINDQASTDLVTGFYRRLGDPEVSRARALQQAQIELLTRPEYRHPAYWAPFLLISSWL